MYALQQTNLNKKIQLLQEITINYKYIYPILLIPLYANSQTQQSRINIYLLIISLYNIMKKINLYQFISEFIEIAYIVKLKGIPLLSSKGVI